MDLTKLKKLSDLKAEKEEITSRFEEIWNQKKNKIIVEARNKFQDFFASTAFETKDLEEKIEARYDSIKISLTDSKSKAGIKAGPYYLTFEITIDMDEPQDIIYKIPVDKYDNNPVLKKVFRVRQYCSDDLTGKIEKIEQSITEIKEMTSKFKEVELGYSLIQDTTSSKNILEHQQLTLNYDDFTSVLSDIFE
ncbi:hypothetical protein [Halanaerobacter jeridensis]|uniref:Uncharacterized protein n=1 Tax=Halanaerobacter jeridensis TaxID=706427 RepID=A0A939BNV0_9FIRM|nr:hypothetical protein [Halanaerobacter jeridensis]MBM7555863.1 hypothetical protein [Halanaerobacter jeridensis]